MGSRLLHATLVDADCGALPVCMKHQSWVGTLVRDEGMHGEAILRALCCHLSGWIHTPETSSFQLP